MATYTVPQVLINQLISEVSLNTVANQNVLVIGPNYELYRYNDEATKNNILVGTFSENKGVVDDGGNTLTKVPYPARLIDNYTPDPTYTKVYLDEAVVNFDVNVATALNTELTDVNSGTFVFDMFFTEKGTRGKTFDRLSSTDEIIIDFADEKELSLERDIHAGDALIFEKNDSVFASRIRATSSSVKTMSSVDTLQLEDTLPWDDLNGVKIYLGTYVYDVSLPKKQKTPNNYNWSVVHNKDTSEYAVTISSNLKIGFAGWTRNSDGSEAEYEVVTGKVYIEHRDLITSLNSIDSIAHATKVSAVLGTVHPDNPLAYGVYMAAINSGDRLVYYCAVPTDDLEGYNAALDKATLTDQVYIICPTTMDGQVITAIQDHIKEMSTPENKLWRISFVSKEAPAQIPVLGTEGDEKRYAKPLTLKGDTSYSGLQFMSDQGDVDSLSVDSSAQLLSLVQVGDILRFYHENAEDTWDDTPNYLERTIADVLSNSVIKLTSPIEVSDTSNAESAAKGSEWSYRVEIWRPLRGQTKVKYLADMSSAMATRRMYNVFPHLGTTGGVEYSGAFLACAVGGLVSSVLPQQPVTNVELNGIDGIPSVYTTYKKADLDTIAAGGTFILMQERPGAKVYVRHQISTEYSSNNMLKAELSVTKNLDSISYYFAEVFAPLIGKYNITPELIEVIRSKLETGLSALESGTGAGLYGPQILVDGTEIVELRQSDVNKDHIYARVRLNLPVPFNYFDLDLVI